MQLKRIKNLFKRNNIEKELLRRRDEVIKRAFAAVRRELPEGLQGFPETIFWIIEPHMEPEFAPYTKEDEKIDRGAESAVVKILGGVREEKKSPYPEPKTKYYKIRDG